MHPTRTLFLALALLTSTAGAAQASSPSPSPRASQALGFQDTGRLHHPRIGPGVVVLADGSVLVVGGYEQATAERWDPATGTWELVGDMGVPREAPGVRLLPDGRVLVTGGHDGESFDVSALVWDPATRAFTVVDGPVPSPAPEATTGPGGIDPGDAVRVETIRLADGRSLTVGGWRKGQCQGFGCTMHQVSEASLFDPVTGTREPVGPLPAPRAESVLVRLADGRVLVIGGHCHCGNDATALLFGPIPGT